MDTPENDLPPQCVSLFDTEEKHVPKRGRVKSARAYFREYCSNTSIHGLHYLSEKRSITERCIWIILICGSITACCYLIHRIYRKYEQSPVIVSFATKESPIFTIPFPAVTICPTTKADRDVFNFTQVMHDRGDHITLLDRDEKYAQYLSVVCENNNKFYMEFPQNDTFTDEFFTSLHKIKIPLDEILFECKFLGMEEDCEGLFTPIMIDESICYTFNMLDRSEMFRDNVAHFANYHQNEAPSQWNIDDGYINDTDLDSYPYRALLSGADSALHLTFISLKKDLDYLCLDDVHGYKVLLHTPHTIPLLKKQYFIVPLDRAVVAVVQPKMMTTSEEVQRFNPDARECYFTRERPLKFFKIYTPENCRLECLSNFTQEACGCVNYFMPRDNSTPICGNGKVECMREAERSLRLVEVAIEMSMRAEEDPGLKFICDCMPVCTDLNYDVEQSQAPWNWQEQFKAARFVQPVLLKEVHLSKLTVFFKMDQFLTSQRNELYGPSDFIANFGGLLGLFTGFSILSFMEIIYFCTLRICCNTRLYNTWFGRHE